MKRKHNYLLAGAAALVAAISFSPSANAALATFTGGHGDIGVELHFHDDEWELELHLHLGDDEPAIVDGVSVSDQEFDPDEILIAVPAAARIVLGMDVSYLGATAGSSVWVLPQDAAAAALIGAPFLGWATEELDPSDWAGNITFSLLSVVSPSGSGHFAVWSGSDVAMSSNVAGFGPGVSQAAGVHDHYNVGFTEPGIWEVTLGVSGVHNVHGPLSGQGTYFFSVIPEPSSALLGMLGAFALGFRRRR